MPSYTVSRKRLYPVTPEGVEVPDFHPWRPERQRARGWSTHDQRLFIHELTRCGSVSVAAKAVGKTPRSAYQLREKRGAESFAVAWHEAQQIGIAKLRDNMVELMIDGELMPRLYHNRIVGYERKQRLRLLLAALESHSFQQRNASNVVYDYGSAEAHRQRLENWEGCLRSRESMLDWDEASREDDEAEYQRQIYRKEMTKLQAAHIRAKAREDHRQMVEAEKKYRASLNQGPRIF